MGGPFPVRAQDFHSRPGVPSSRRRCAQRRGSRPGSLPASPDDQEGRRAARRSPVTRHRRMERKKIFRSVWFWVVLVILIALAFSSVFRGTGNYTDVSTSTALAQFDDNNVAK